MADDVSSFWGPVTSTRDFCEKNYAYSSYIAEFYNTFSNVPGILYRSFQCIKATVRAEICHSSHIKSNTYHRQYALSCYIATCLFERDLSVFIPLVLLFMILHLCISSRQQQSDETPMVWEILLYMYILYSPDWNYRTTMPTFLFIYGTFFATVHSFLRYGFGFKVHYIILCLLCIPRMYKYYIHTKDKAAKQIAKWYIATFLIGTICGFCDRAFCNTISQWIVNPQGHALWHVFTGFNSYLANTS